MTLGSGFPDGAVEERATSLKALPSCCTLRQALEKNHHPSGVYAGAHGGPAEAQEPPHPSLKLWRRTDPGAIEARQSQPAQVGRASRQLPALARRPCAAESPCSDHRPRAPRLPTWARRSRARFSLPQSPGKPVLPGRLSPPRQPTRPPPTPPTAEDCPHLPPVRDAQRDRRLPQKAERSKCANHPNRCH